MRCIVYDASVSFSEKKVSEDKEALEVVIEGYWFAGRSTLAVGFRPLFCHETTLMADSRKATNHDRLIKRERLGMRNEVWSHSMCQEASVPFFLLQGLKGTPGAPTYGPEDSEHGLRQIGMAILTTIPSILRRSKGANHMEKGRRQRVSEVLSGSRTERRRRATLRLI
jgi:hypothetical protein